MLPDKVESLAKPLQRVVEERFISLLRSCKTCIHLHQIQAQIVTHGLEHNDFVAPSFITTCARLGKMVHARKLFDKIPQPNTATWNTMFRVYSQNEHHREVVVLFGLLYRTSVVPNCFTFPMTIKSCAKVNAVKESEEVHCCAAKRDFKSNPFVATSLIDMYSIRGSIKNAYEVFGEMLDRNVVIWTAIIKAYILCGDVASARRLFDLAPERDVVIWSTMVSGYIEQNDMAAARELFNKMPNRDVMSWNAMLIGYASNVDVGSFEKVFDEMPERNVYSWNGLIGGYVKNGLFSNALESFKRMLVEGHVVPNDFTLVGVLSACSRLAHLIWVNGCMFMQIILGIKGICLLEML